MAATTNYPQRQLGRNGPTVAKLGFGTMGIGAFYGQTTASEETILKALTYAADRGLTFWDTADIYGNSEATLGKWFETTNRRKDIFLATKFGSFNLASTPDTFVYRLFAFLRSLSELKTDYVDLYYQHRVDPKVPIEVVLETLREFVEAGKIKYLGLSESSIETLKRAKNVKGLGEKVIAVQMEYSPFTLDIELPCKSFAQEAEDLGISVIAYSPLARGLITGRYRSRADFDQDDFRLILPRWSEENFPKNLEVVDKLKQIAQKYSATPSQVTLAWILAEHPTWIPIPGSRTIERIEENARGAEIELSVEAIKEIRELVDKAEVAGSRNPALDWLLAGVEGNSLPLAEWKGEQST
ncbi:uncharacterized protein LACBIDRAFT_227919 [Laccaria bicolor S238N-H82]|uniref:Predicted protein n=1 Tax=Laccaria bicolor (strain S238N-H82 / ATCC MYA-4686) TaxID=486041 RepID=B0CQF7_LACBS|nr:uncharacterized protein LACBIDRAFT_227919 [Laccaria bicolor S238N-H82]EDR16197.1 predicted protein [Laccaria bicolor S238N-H82]|eukprot:XP_001874405.1 predicted protein [Laccaria bicolor S238N-H82]